MLSYQQTVNLIRKAGFQGHTEPAMEEGHILVSVPTIGVLRFAQTRKDVKRFVELWKAPRETPKPTLH